MMAEKLGIAHETAPKQPEKHLSQDRDAACSRVFRNRERYRVLSDASKLVICRGSRGQQLPDARRYAKTSAAGLDLISGPSNGCLY
jgi:hypothetical protein